MSGSSSSTLDVGIGGGGGGDEWTEHTDPSTGQRYFHNASTGETTWRDPRQPRVRGAWQLNVDVPSADGAEEAGGAGGQASNPVAASPQPEVPPMGSPLAAHLHVHIDPETNRPYWYDERTGETTWEKPGKEADYAQASGEGHDQQAAAEAPDWRGDWVELFDEASGCPYYYNQVTQHSSWTKPEGWDWEQEAVEPPVEEVKENHIARLSRASPQRGLARSRSEMSESKAQRKMRKAKSIGGGHFSDSDDSRGHDIAVYQFEL